MWVDAEHFEHWQVWTGAEWPNDEGVPERGGCTWACRVIRRSQKWEGPMNPSPELAARIDGMIGKTACWMYHVVHGSHQRGIAPPSVDDHRRRAAGDAA